MIAVNTLPPISPRHDVINAPPYSIRTTRATAHFFESMPRACQNLLTDPYPFLLFISYFYFTYFTFETDLFPKH